MRACMYAYIHAYIHAYRYIIYQYIKGTSTRVIDTLYTYTYICTSIAALRLVLESSNELAMCFKKPWQTSSMSVPSACL